MIRIAICDDNPQELEIIHDMVQDFMKENPDTDLSVRCFHSACDLLAAIQNGGSFHVYLLDIVMPRINGIDVGESIRKTDELAIIIYLTSSQDYALESFSVFPFQYLLKPIPGSALFEVLKKAILKINVEKAQFLSVKTQEGIFAVRFHQILYVEYCNHRLVFHLLDGSTLVSVSSREPFDQRASELLKDSRFVRPHVSYVINMQHVHTISANKFMMTNETSVPISQNSFTMTKRQYMEFLLKERSLSKC